MSSAVDLCLWACFFSLPAFKSIIENGRDCIGDSSGLYYVLAVWHYDLNELIKQQGLLRVGVRSVMLLIVLSW